MVTVRRSATIQAYPETIWNYLADPAHWSQWDPDIISVGTTEVGITEGRTWPVRFKPGLSGTLVFDDIELHRSFEWDIRVLGGLIEAEAEFRMEPADEPGLTTLSYEFEMEGPLGQLLTRFASKRIINAVEVGLANIAAAAEQR